MDNEKLPLSKLIYNNNIEEIKQYARDYIFPKLQRPYIYRLIDAIAVYTNCLQVRVPKYKVDEQFNTCPIVELDREYSMLSTSIQHIENIIDLNNHYTYMCREYAISCIMPHLHKYNHNMKLGRIIAPFEYDDDHTYKNIIIAPILQYNKKWDIYNKYRDTILNNLNNINNSNYIWYIDNQSMLGAAFINTYIVRPYLDRNTPKYDTLNNIYIANI